MTALVSDSQVAKLMAHLSKGKSKGVAAMKADMHPQTARKYRRSGKLPSESQPVHDWRTRPDPFADDWSEVVTLLTLTPALKPHIVFEYLQTVHPGRHEPGEIRTLERRMRVWKAQHGPDLEVFSSRSTGRVRRARSTSRTATSCSSRSWARRCRTCCATSCCRTRTGSG